MRKILSAALIVLCAGQAAAQDRFEPAKVRRAKITSISAITTDQAQTITITGKRFGNHKPYNGRTNLLAFADNTAGWQAGYKPAGDTITISVSQWTPTQIVITGFGGTFGQGNNVLTNGDAIVIEVWTPKSKGLGNGASCASTVGAGAVNC